MVLRWGPSILFFLASLAADAVTASTAARPPARTVPPKDTTAGLWAEMGANSATGNGLGWGWSLQGAPSLAVNPANGDVYLTWTGAGQDIYVRRWNGSVWSDVGAGSSSGGGVSQSPTLSSQYPRLAVRGEDGHVFLSWLEVPAGSFGGLGDVHVAEFDGTQWIRLGANGGRVSSSGKVDAYPDIILSKVFSTTPMPILAWEDDGAIYVKRWTGPAFGWAEMGAGSASGYPSPYDLNPPPNTPRNTAYGINADDHAIYTDGDNSHLSSSYPRLLLEPNGRPAVVFKNGSSSIVDSNNQPIADRYPYGLHVRRFTGSNASPAYVAWEDIGRITGGQNGVLHQYAANNFAVAGIASGYGLYVATDIDDYGTGDVLTTLRILQFTGTSWVSLPALPGTGIAPTGSAFQPALALQPDGNLVVAWQQSIDDELNYEIHVRRSANVSGQFVWQELGGGSGSGAGISANEGWSTWAAMASHTLGGVTRTTVAWSDEDFSSEFWPLYVRQANSQAAQVPTLSIADVAVTEGYGGVRSLGFTATLSQPATADVSFSVQTLDLPGGGNVAKAGIDYVASGRVPLNIPAGQASTTFTVKIHGDNIVEPDEAFGLVFSGVIGATPGNGGSALGWILNDDALAAQSHGSACDRLSAAIADRELRMAAGGLSERRGLPGILELESRRHSLGCR